MDYLGKPLANYSLLALQNILAHFDIMLAERDDASQHEKFTKGVGNKKALNFPPPNPAFIELKEAIEKEIGMRE